MVRRLLVIVGTLWFCSLSVSVYAQEIAIDVKEIKSMEILIHPDGGGTTYLITTDNAKHKVSLSRYKEIYEERRVLREQLIERENAREDEYWSEVTAKKSAITP